MFSLRRWLVVAAAALTALMAGCEVSPLVPVGDEDKPPAASDWCKRPIPRGRTTVESPATQSAGIKLVGKEATGAAKNKVKLSRVSKDPLDGRINVEVTDDDFVLVAIYGGTNNTAHVKGRDDDGTGLISLPLGERKERVDPRSNQYLVVCLMPKPDDPKLDDK